MSDKPLKFKVIVQALGSPPGEVASCASGIGQTQCHLDDEWGVKIKKPVVLGLNPVFNKIKNKLDGLLFSIWLKTSIMREVTSSVMEEANWSSPFMVPVDFKSNSTRLFTNW